MHNSDTYICESCSKEFPIDSEREGNETDGYVCAPCFKEEEAALTYVLEQIIAKGYLEEEGKESKKSKEPLTEEQEKLLNILQGNVAGLLLNKPI